MIKQFIGIILILVIITAYVLWWRFNKNQAGVTAKKGNIAEFDITVKGVYSPAVIKAKKGQRVKINFTRRENAECSRFVIFDDFKIRKEYLDINHSSIQCESTVLVINII